MAALSDYVTGTISLTNGSVDFTGTSTGWLLAGFKEGDTIIDITGATEYMGVVATIDANGAGTLTKAWEGPTLVDVAYRMRFQPDGARVSAQARNLIELLGNGNILALAGLSGSANQVPMFTGPGAMVLVPKTDLVTGVAYDVQVDLLADRAAYDGQAEGFSVLVANVGDGRAAVYAKASATSGDWSDPAYVTGSAVTLDVTDVDEVAYGTPPDVTLTPIAGGYNLSFDIPRGMIIEPGTTTTLAPGTPASVTFVPVTGGYRLDLSIPSGEGFSSEGDYSGATAYVKGDVVQRLGSSWIALQATTGNTPPTLPTTSNAYWQLLARQGIDGAGTVNTIVQGPGITVDLTDPTAPIVLLGGATSGERIGLTDAATPIAVPSALLHIVNEGSVSCGLRVTSSWTQSGGTPFNNHDDSLFEVFNDVASNSANQTWGGSFANAYNDIPAGVTDSGLRTGVLGWAVSVSVPGYTHEGTLGSQVGVYGRAGFQGEGSGASAIIQSATGVRGEVVLESTSSTVQTAVAVAAISEKAGPGAISGTNYAVFASAANGAGENFSFYGNAGKFFQAEEANFAGVLKQAGVAMKAIRNISFDQSVDEFTTTSGSFQPTLYGLNYSALSPTSSVLFLCAAQLEAEIPAAGNAGMQIRPYRYTGTTFVPVDLSQPFQLVQTALPGATVIRGNATLMGRMTAAQRRSDNPSLWGFNPHILANNAGTVAKLKYFDIVFVEYEP